MGVESRDWYRDGSRSPRGGSTRVLAWIAGAVIVLAVLVLISPTARDRIGIRLPFGLEETFRGQPRPVGIRVLPLPGAPAIGSGAALYARDDPWRAWLAPESTCPRGEDRGASAAVQTQVLLCLVNYARERQGLGQLALSPLLSAASAAKASEIERCREFEHDPCGRRPDAAALALGYRGSFGENLYIAEAPLTSPRVAVDRWLNSPGHRENLFQPDWRTIGIAKLDGVTFGRFGGAVLWVNEFGDR